MRDFASCFNEYAVHVADSYACASHSGNSCISPAMTPSVQNTVVCIYRAVLSNRKNIPIRVSWCRTAASQGLTINFGDDPATSFKLSSNTRLFRKKRGSKSLEFDNSKVEVFWDLSAARYCAAGPEPIDGYYVLATIDSQLTLVLGDMAEEASLRKKIKPSGIHAAKCALISRQEHFSGNALYSTKAQFSDTGTPHDVVVSCYGENATSANKHPVLSVSIDKKMVIRVKRLQWNFRGNHTIFVDGLLVDLMWDVHDWFYNPGAGRAGGPGLAVFMFRTRSGMDSRLWLEEKLQHKKDEDKVDFSFLIYASRS